MNETMKAPGIGDRVLIYDRTVCNDPRGGGLIRARVRQPGVFTIVRENRHGDWTVRDDRYGCIRDVLHDDVEFADWAQR
uniref:hypothetical protein n=1 Tax=Pseudonocardia sp. CA-138482 TaxID=3240023 RepID=UPI003F496D9E